MTKKLTDDEIGFRQGCGMAIGLIVRLHNHPEIAYDVAQEFGYTLAQYRQAGLEDFDLSQIRLALKGR